MLVLALLKDLVFWGVTAWCKSLGQDQEPHAHPVRCLARLPPSFGDTKACVPAGKAMMGSPAQILFFCLTSWWFP